MIRSLSHYAMKPGKQDALATVNNVLPFVARVDSAIPVRAVGGGLLAGFPVNAYSPVLIEKVLRLRDVAKVGYSVIRLVAVDVINNLRRLTVNKKPGKAMSKVSAPAYANAGVAIRAGLCDGNVAGAGKQPRFRVVRQDISNRVGYKFCSHAESLLSVVRGSVVGATDTPILSQGVANG